MEKVTINVVVSFEIRFREIATGWEADSKYGMTTAATKEECIRILSDRVK